MGKCGEASSIRRGRSSTASTAPVLVVMRPSTALLSLGTRGNGQASRLGGFEVDDNGFTRSLSLRLPRDFPRRLQELFTGEHNIFPSLDEPPLPDNSLLIDQEEGPLGDPELCQGGIVG